MKTTKFASLFLALVMVCSLVLVACGGKENNTGDLDNLIVNKTEEQVDPNDVWDLETHDLQGHVFYFLIKDVPAAHLKLNEVYAEQLNNEIINDAVYRRNAILEEKYNCTIQQDIASDVYNTIREPLIAGEYTYDVIYNRIISSRSLSSANLLVDLNAVENFQYDKNWWDQNMRTGLQISGKSFFANGDAGTSDDRSSQVMFFNRDLIEKNRLEDPYELVKSGNWTNEKFYEMSEATFEDNGDGIAVPGEDVFAYICPSQNNWAHVVASGVTLSTVSSSGDIYMPGYPSEEVLNVWAELKPILTNPHRDVSDMGSRFRNGKAGFYTMNLSSLQLYGDTTINFGVIPFPKRNAEQEEYYTIMESGICHAYSIPVTVDQISEYQAAGFESGVEMVGYFLNAMGYESRNTLTIAFYDQLLKRQMVQNQETADMLDLALKNKIIDPVVFYDFGSIGNIFRDAGCDGWSGTNGTKTLAVGSDVNYENLTSLYEARLNSARKALDTYLKNLEISDAEN